MRTFINYTKLLLFAIFIVLFVFYIIIFLLPTRVYADVPPKLHIEIEGDCYNQSVPDSLEYIKRSNRLKRQAGWKEMTMNERWNVASLVSSNKAEWMVIANRICGKDGDYKIFNQWYWRMKR